MNRIEAIFQRLRKGGGKALMPFLTAGDPDVATTIELLHAAERTGAAVCEVGIPFSDPIADGPVIQASMSYALANGVTPGGIFEAVAAARDKLSIGLVAMVSYSIVHRLGGDRFLHDAASAGFDGLIIPDLPLDEAGPTLDAARAAGLTVSLLIAPGTPDDRAERIARACTGFVYVLSRAGLTGEKAGLPAELPRRVKALRAVTDLPIAVGFGVSTPEHVREVVSVADAAIVGSAIMRRVAEHRDEGKARVVDATAGFIGELATGLQGPAAPTD